MRDVALSRDEVIDVAQRRCEETQRRRKGADDARDGRCAGKR